MALDLEGALRRVEDLHLARAVGLDPDGGFGLSHVPQERTEDE
jgi:hypothetical protein